MSYEADEVYDVYAERHLRSRKHRPCDACRETIRPGHQYTRIGICFDGRWQTVVRCARCQTLHEHLREKCRAADDGAWRGLWPEEGLDCGQAYESEWGVIPDDVAALAFWLPGDPL